MSKFKSIRIIAEMEIHKRQKEQIILAAEIIHHFFNLIGATDLVSVNIHDFVDLRSFYIDGPDSSQVVDGEAAMGYMIYQNHTGKDEFINILLVRGQILHAICGQEKALAHGLAHQDKFGIIEVGWEDKAINRFNEYLLLLHELGHIYGAASEKRLGTDWVEKFGRHCPDICVMNDDFTRVLEKIDLLNKPFCDLCLLDLKNYFHSEKKEE